MSDSKKANILIMYPNNQTSILLGRELVIDVNNVSYYMPGDVHQQVVPTLMEEVSLEGAGLEVTVMKTETLDDLASYDYVIFPYLRLLPSKSADKFALMCANLFQ